MFIGNYFFCIRVTLVCCCLDATMVSYILPVCVFDCKMSLLCTTYLKIYREENYLLLFNVLAMLVSAVFALLAAFVFNSMIVAVFGIVLAIAVRSVCSELFLIEKHLDHMRLNKILFELAFALVFILFARIDAVMGFLFTAFVYFLYFISNRNAFYRSCNLLFCR